MYIVNFLTQMKIMQILLFALVLRLFAFYLLPDLYFVDAQSYINAGQEFVLDGQLDEHLAMPLYPLVTYIFGSSFNIKLANIVISTLSVLLVYHLTLELFKEKIYAVVSSLVTAVYPFFIFYSITGLTETLYLFFLLSIFLLLYKKQFFWASVIIVLSILHRPILDLLAPILIFAFAYFVHKVGLKKSIIILVQYLIVYIVLMTPWWLHQYKKYDQFVRLNLGEGIVWYAGNNPLNKTGGGIAVEKGVNGGDVDFGPFADIKDPIEKNKILKQKAFEHIKNNPIHFIELAKLKFIRFWRLWPYASEYSSYKYIILSIASFGTVLLLSLVYIIFYLKDHFRFIFPIFMFIAYLNLIHMILISSIRYRLPVEPFLIIFASFVFVKLLLYIGKEKND